MTDNRFIYLNGSTLHYLITGNGNQPLLFFHGFGQDHSVYLSLIRSLSEDYRLYIFDLYFHGQSIWGKGEQPLEKDEWKETMEVFLRDNGIAEFSLVGFSLGGKFALTTLEFFAGRVRKIFLIAPDGIKTSFWYSMATYPVVLRRFFKGMISNYKRFETLARILASLKLVDKGLIRFADHQMDTEAKRKRVYYSWVVFRHLQFSLKKIADLINECGIETVIIVGRYDKVIAPENMRPFLSSLKNKRFEVLETGHNGLIQQSLPFLRKEK